jgi:hypothetical protein
VSKRAAQNIDTERFYVKKLNEGDVKEQYHATSRNMFAALENLEDSGDINRAWDNIRENIKISAQEGLGYREPKHSKPWFDKERSKLADRRKQAKLQWLQDSSEVNEDNLSDVRWDASRHFRNKNREYLKGKINELESNKENRQTEMHTAKSSVPDPSASEVEVATGKLKRYKSPSVNQILAELIQAGEERLCLEIHKLIKLIWNKEELPHQ